MSFIVSGDDRDVICVQDAAKTLAELVSGETDMTYDDDVSRATIESIWSLWKNRAGSIVVPGHDMPLALAGNTVVRIGRSQAGISAVFGKNLADITRFELSWPDC